MNTRHRIKGLTRREDTIQRLDVLAGVFPMTWAADDRRFVGFNDGVDLSDPPTTAYHSRVYEIVGDPPAVEFKEVPGYPHMPMRMTESHYASFWGTDILAVEGRIYQYLSTSNHPYFKPDGSFWPDFYMANVKLIYSPDNGCTWHNADGSTPVVWDDWDALSHENMIFYNEEPAGAFVCPTFLQMGRNYELNKDGYVYVYSGNGGADGTANQLLMFRVPKSQVPDRDAYEFFAGLRPDGSPTWTNDISARAAVHTFPRGWVSGMFEGGMPSGWWTSVVYYAPLGQYLMAASGTGPGPEGGWFGKPSYLGFWVAPTPWGPFRQIHEELAWTPAGELNARGFAPQIAPQWISADGKSFWFVWSDYGSKRTEDYNPDKHVVRALNGVTDDAEFARILKTWNRENQLNPRFNMQRIDLVLE